MSDIAISGMTALGGAPATNDLLVVVDVSDHTQAPTGTTKSMTTANLFTAPTIDSATLTGTTTTALVNATAANTGLTVNVSSANALAARFVSSSASNGALITLENTGIGGTARNIGLASNFNVNGAFEVLVSTANGGNPATAGASAFRCSPTAATLPGTLALASDLTINTNKFTVTASSGNTAIAGTLVVTGGVTATAGVTIGTTVGAGGQGYVGFQATNGLELVGITGGTYDFTIASAAGVYVMRVPTGTANADFEGNLTVNTNKFTVTASSGNTAIAGTLTVTGSTSTGITAGSASEGQTITAVKSVSVGSVSPTTLLSLVGLRGGQAFVYGDDGSGHTFIDIIWFGAAGTAVGPASQPLNSTAGTASRAYGISSTNLTLQMTSGTYTVKFAPTLITTT